MRGNIKCEHNGSVCLNMFLKKKVFFNTIEYIDVNLSSILDVKQNIITLPFISLIIAYVVLEAVPKVSKSDIVAYMLEDITNKPTQFFAALYPSHLQQINIIVLLQKH